MHTPPQYHLKKKGILYKFVESYVYYRSIQSQPPVFDHRNLLKILFFNLHVFTNTFQEKKMKSALMMMALAAGTASATELTPEVCFLITHTLFGK